jgi:hypothetical protein
VAFERALGSVHDMQQTVTPPVASMAVVPAFRGVCVGSGVLYPSSAGYQMLCAVYVTGLVTVAAVHGCEVQPGVNSSSAGIALSPPPQTESGCWACASDHVEPNSQRQQQHSA